jgi:hypothetical protein
VTKKFGELCVVSNRDAIKAKIKEHGQLSHWLGWAKTHAPNTFRMFNPKTRRVFLSRDVVSRPREFEDEG